MGRTLVGTSHKGGTGRSVTLANVAFHMCHSGLDVCLVDLDLTSPTMGAVLGMEDYEMGAGTGTANRPRSVYDLLYNGNDARATISGIEYALVDVWNSSSTIGGARPVMPAKFEVLPGKANISLRQLDYSRLAKLLSVLNRKFDVVLLDVRSGTSEIASALTERSADEEIQGWLLHYRWTHQHLIGVQNFADSLFADGENRYAGRVNLIKTAVPTIEGPRSRQDFLRDYDQHLQQRSDRLPQELKHAGIGSIPFDSMLLWRETIITQDMVDDGLASRDTFDAFASLAETLAGTVRGGDA